MGHIFFQLFWLLSVSEFKEVTHLALEKPAKTFNGLQINSLS